MIAIALLSARIAALACLADVAIGLPLAHLLARGRFRGRRAVEVLLMAPLVLPPTVTGFLLLVLFGRHGWLGAPLRLATGLSVPFTTAAAVLAAAVVAFPLFLRTARAAIESVAEAHVADARALGLGPFRAALRVTLPLASRGIWAGAALAFGRAFGEFGATLMLAGDIPGETRTLSLAVYDAAAAGSDGTAGVLSGVLLAASLAILGLAALLERRRW
ncbi:MAG: molybdate ABC transporter permease subunit [Myxococcales bacterium]